MSNSRRPIDLIALVALILAVGAPSPSVAQKIDWQAGELASPFPAVQTEPQLIEQLRSATPEGKAMACKQLSIYGTKAAVPELAKLLSDDHMASWARIALEAIPDPAADKALVEAAGKLQGNLLIGTINSIGAKRAASGVGQLSKLLKDKDEQVASAAAVALGKIGGEQVAHVLYEAWSASTPAVRSAIAEGGILCSEQLLAEGKNETAVAILDALRGADIPKQRVLEATRGAILARGEQGIPLLVEQLKSSDAAFFQMAMSTAREIRGPAVVEALSSQLANAEPQRASLIIYAIGDREELVLPKSVLQAATTGDAEVRLAAIALIGRWGDESAVAPLLDIASGGDEKLSPAAKTALAGLPGNKVNAELKARLSKAKGKSLPILIELAGERRIEATPDLVKALENSEKSIRNAALAALGETVSFDDLEVLISEVVDAKNDPDREIAEKALNAASIRMPKREAAAAHLADAMSKASNGAKVSMLRIMGAMGGPTALETIATAVKTRDAELQDVGTDVLGKWMTADAAPVLLEITKDPANDKKYQVRALRGYLRIARQLKTLPDEERIDMARQALDIAERADERKLVLQVLERCPSSESIKLASALVDDKEVRDQAVQTAIFIGEKIKDKDPEAARAAAEKALEASPPKELADRARALTSP
jgi:HEAT repeat protein